MVVLEYASSARPAVVVEKMAERAETMRNGRDREAVRTERDRCLVRVAWELRPLRVPLAMGQWPGGGRRFRFRREVRGR